MSEVFDVILGGLDTEVDVTIADSTGVDPSVLLALRGEKGDTGAAGQDGTDGADGYSPTATVTKSGDTATITITDINGTTTATVKDGTQANAFTAEFGTTTYADVKDAYDDGAILICTVDDSGNTVVLQLVYFDATNEIFYFAEPNGDGWYWTQLSNADGWDDGTRYLASTDVATQLADGLMSALDKQKLDGLSKRNIWYGTCTTSASSSPKSITTASGDFSLTAGNMLVVLFSHANSLSSASLQVDGGASKSAYPMDGTSDISNRWGSNELVMFAYDGTKFIMLEQGKASTTAYGITKLNNTVTSTSTSEAATANAVKSAYDNGGVQSVNGSTGAVSLSIHNVPSGGTSGQVLSKASGTDYDLAWSTPSSGSVTDVTVDGLSVVTGGVASIDLTGKQDELESGVNIRTINGTSVLGSGDISVAAGGTPIPTADTVAEFDSSACMNSSDMSAQDIEDFVDALNISTPATLVDFFYPIGSYYETSNASFNPNIAWNGTWVLEAEGLVHIGAGENYTLGDTGGEKTHTLTVTEMPSHTHGHYYYGGSGVSWGYTYSNGSSTKSAATEAASGIVPNGGGGAHNNMQPYIVVNRWHRTA